MRRSLTVLAGGIAAAVLVATTSLAAPPTQASVETLYDTMVATRSPVPTVDVEDVTPQMVLVDVRPQDERAVSTLPGSIPLEKLEADPSAFADKKIVFFCTLGVRSHDTTQAWGSRGLDVANLRGSALAWTHAGKPLATPSGEPTTRLHTWSRAFALQAEGYEATW